MTLWTGTLPLLLAGDIPPATDWAEILGALHGLTDTWTSYTPTWTASGGTPAVGTGGVIEARYRRSGHDFEYAGRLLIGTSPTLSSGTYSISSPVTAESGNRYIGGALMLDSSTPANNQAAVVRPDGANAVRLYGSLVGGQWSATTPFVPAAGDQFLWHIRPQAA